MGTKSTPSPTGRAVLDVVLMYLPDLSNVADNVKGGNPRRTHKQPSLGLRRRPPKSFPGGAVPLLVQEMLPLREMIERGRSEIDRVHGVLKAAPKAGDETRGPDLSEMPGLAALQKAGVNAKKEPPA